MHLYQEVAHRIGQPCFDLFERGYTIGCTQLDDDGEWMITDCIVFGDMLYGFWHCCNEEAKAKYGLAVEFLIGQCHALLDAREAEENVNGGAG